MNTEDKAPICQNCSQDPAVTGYHICYGCAHDIENNGDDDVEWFDEAVWINASIEYAHRIDTDDNDTDDDDPIGQGDDDEHEEIISGECPECGGVLYTTNGISEQCSDCGAKWINTD